MIIVNDFVPFISLSVIGLLLLLCSIAWHELGHLLQLKVYKIPTKVMFIKKSWISYTFEIIYDDTKLSTKDNDNVLASGIVFGLIPIFVCQLFMSFPIWLMIIPYLIGCKYDIKELVKIE